jgi:DNA-binding transcriptional regulator/RsmH inhibitor MraZ
MYNGRLDDKGRMKLAAELVQYFAALPEKKLFVTSLDRRTAQIYPISAWRSNEQFFQEYREDPTLARKIAFNAADLGSETEVDSQGRLLFSPDLRRELGLENQTLHLYARRKHIEVLSEKQYEDLKNEATGTTPDEVGRLETAGMN